MAVAAVAVVGVVDPHQPGHYPVCPFWAVTGWYCPGCGSLRAVHALVHGDLATAWQRNPLAVVAAPVLVAAWVAWGLRLLGRSAWSPTRIPAGAVRALAAVVVLYAVARNVPGWTLLSPV